MSVTSLDPIELAERATGAVASGFPGAVITNVEQLIGGTSSLTYSADMTHEGSTSKVVVKAAPPGVEPVRNRDVLRQARLLQTLHGVEGIAVPQVFGTDTGAPVDVPPLFVMSYVPGESYEPASGMGKTSATTEQLRDRAYAAARMAAVLHKFPTDHPGLGGEPVMGLDAEVGRWAKAFSTVADDLRPGADVTHAKLTARLPEAMTPSVLHGDWRLGNMQCNGSSIDAVIDWEIWSLSDRRVDLGWFLLNSDDRHPSTVNHGVMPSRDALVAAYEDACGQKLADVEWFEALVRYKQAAVTALIVKNNRKLPQPGVDPERMATLIPLLLASADELLG